MIRVLAAVLLAAALPAPGEEPAPAVTVAVALSYFPGDPEPPAVPLTLRQGQRLMFASADNLGAHTITSVDLDDNANYLFWSEQIGLGQSTEVHGVPSLAPGTYRFYCWNHPGMDGVLTVTPPAPGE